MVHVLFLICSIQYRRCKVLVSVWFSQFDGIFVLQINPFHRSLTMDMVLKLGQFSYTLCFSLLTWRRPILCSGAALLEGEAVEVPGVVGVSSMCVGLRSRWSLWVCFLLPLSQFIAGWVRFRFPGIVLWIRSHCQESRFGSLRGHAFRSEQQLLLSSYFHFGFGFHNQGLFILFGGLHWWFARLEALLFACKRQNKTNPKCEYFCFLVLFEKVKALEGTCDEFCYIRHSRKNKHPSNRPLRWILLEGLRSRSVTILKCFFHEVPALNRSAGWLVICVLELLIVVDRCISCCKTCFCSVEDGVGWGGMLTFTWTCKTCCGSVEDGVGWDVNVPLDLQTMLWFRGGWRGVGWDATVHMDLQTMLWLRGGWGGVGWDVNVHLYLQAMLWLRKWLPTVGRHPMLMTYCRAWQWRYVYRNEKDSA